MESRALLKLVRIHNVIGAMLGDLMGYLVSSFWNIEPFKIVLSMIVVGMVASGGNVINDYFDVEIDRINKPDRPIPSGKVTPRQAKIIALGSFIIGIGLSILLGPIPFMLALITSILLYLYAMSLKKSGVYGNVIVSLANGLAIFYGGVSFMQGQWLIRVALPSFYSFFLTLVREFVKGIEDYNGDKVNGVKTLAVTMGIDRTWIISKILLVVLIIISPIPLLFGFNFLYLALLVALLIPSVIISIIQRPSIASAAKARSYLKVSMLSGIIAFLLGSMPISSEAYLLLFSFRILSLLP